MDTLSKNKSRSIYDDFTDLLSIMKYVKIENLQLKV